MAWWHRCFPAVYLSPTKKAVTPLTIAAAIAMLGEFLNIS
jgi:hypothetical protein